jgi:hypothetical protein
MGAAPYFDGDHTIANQEGPIRYWQDEVTRSRLYAVKVRQIASYWKALAISAPGPQGGFLVHESQPRAIGGPLLEWERTYADVPAAFSRCEMLTYPIQLIVTTSGLESYSQSLAEIPINTPVQVNYSYALTTTAWDGVTFPVVRKCTIVMVGPLFYHVGSPPTLPATNVQGADTEISRWKGDIYQARNMILNVPDLELGT